jgi:AraC-like DNA-binding protein
MDHRARQLKVDVVYASLAGFDTEQGKTDSMMETFDPDAIERAVFVLAQRHDALDEPWHAYRRTRLIHVSEGILMVSTDAGRWVVPPRHAMWVLPGVLHRVHAAGTVCLHTLYADPDAAPAPEQCGVVEFDRLAEELLVAVAGLAEHYPPDGRDARLVRVLLDRLPDLAVAPLGLKQPVDPRIQRIAEALSENPAEHAILDALAEAAGVTARTAARLFVKETGQTFGQWRQQLRLLAALERLATGASVTQVALEVGYNDVSSFIAVFRDALGETPARYFR